LAVAQKRSVSAIFGMNFEHRLVVVSVPHGYACVRLGAIVCHLAPLNKSD
jgi:hypothetical protein